MKLKVPSKFKCKLVPPSHEVSVIHLLFSAPPKMCLHPPNYSHFLFYSHLLQLYKINSNDALLFNAWPCPSWFGLGLLGLWA